MALTPSLVGRLSLTVVLGGFAARVAAQPLYSVTDLGVLPTFTASDGNGINASGQVAGSSTRTGVEHGSVWTSGTLQDVGTLSGFGSSAAVGVNAAGQASGEVYNNTTSHAFVWTSGSPVLDIHDTTTGFTSSEALGTINTAGQIVGQLTRADGMTHPFLWTGGPGMMDLGPMPGLTYGAAYGVNDAGAVVGTSWDDFATAKAFLWTSTTGFTDLGGLPGFLYAWATAINASGQVVGNVSSDSGPIDGFFWTPDTGMMTDLGALPGFLYIQPWAINGQGVAVGQASNDPPTSGRAFIWQNGLITDLNTLIPDGSGWVLGIASGINDSGQITGTGTVGGQTHAFLLTLNP
jgi:probable HAF family extracellular repeat protein